MSNLPPDSQSVDWKVYIVLCSDNSLYTGISTNVEKRVQQHSAGRGARYFRGRQPVRVVYFEEGHSRSSASCREVQIKAMTRAGKDILISQWKL